MKVIIDEVVFNKAIAEEKLQLAEWLLENGCPCDDTSYVQNFDILILNWLKSKNIAMSKDCLSNVIDKKADINTINWFIDNGAIVNSDVLISCIRNNRNEILWNIKRNIELSSMYYKPAIIAENIEVLDHLLNKNIQMDSSIPEIAMKYGKKASLKWLIKNDLF